MSIKYSSTPVLTEVGVLLLVCEGLIEIGPLSKFGGIYIVKHFKDISYRTAGHIHRPTTSCFEVLRNMPKC
jgi:hypothetical protein